MATQKEEDNPSVKYHLHFESQSNYLHSAFSGSSSFVEVSLCSRCLPFNTTVMQYNFKLVKID